MGELGAKTFFLIGSDYAFGRGMLEFTADYINEKGGQVLGDEYLPMDGTDWTPIISKLKASGADALITSTAGGAPNVTLTKQLRAREWTFPMATSRSTRVLPGTWGGMPRASTFGLVHH